MKKECTMRLFTRITAACMLVSGYLSMGDALAIPVLSFNGSNANISKHTIQAIFLALIYGCQD
jgi:hypothetical protein